MIPAIHGYTQEPCLFLFPSITAWTPLVLALLALCLCVFLAIQLLIRYCQLALPTNPDKIQPASDAWAQLSAMEKGKSSTSPPPASACDVLKPLSANGTFPSSGAVAARAREQMQAAASSPSSTGSPRSSDAGSEATGPVQKRSQSVQQMREVDANGVRTWRRLVVEYR
ncbi:hypothetical protein N7462_005644 [Penicillium macrosclerotiorum]|uniref:uncharacterized protein n=1 Tax=Penicillium macrosclerotiorum TaxID=303699 RepID=UPI002549BBAA|nr:uncharacterized protein N7462_005644 [Penicillium macrosclerotiorum]KAJ5682479.1 hypothetical protein N7462_005644 [Penicillium macrosclerotiorum]